MSNRHKILQRNTLVIAYTENIHGQGYNKYIYNVFFCFLITY